MLQRRLSLILLVMAGLAAPAVGATAEAPDLSGGELYQVFCASCHGVTAHGDGIVAPMLKVTVPDLTHLSERNFGQFPAIAVRQVIDGRSVLKAHGSREMPIWGREFYYYDGEDAARRKQANELITRLVEYLRSIQTAKLN